MCSLEEAPDRVTVHTTTGEFIREESDGIPPELKEGTVLKIVYEGMNAFGQKYSIVRVEDPGSAKPLADCPAS